MDELSAVAQLLDGPPPGPEVVEAAWLRVEQAARSGPSPATRAAHGGWHAPGLVRDGAAPRRWGPWLAPLAAAAAVVGVVVASVSLPGMILRHHDAASTAASAGAFAKVPPFFVAVPENPGPALVGTTATGAVLGTVTPPRPYTVFQWVTGAADDRTFVLAAGVTPKPGTNAMDRGPLKFYRLHLSRSGHPGPLAALPIPPTTGTIAGFSLSPDGSQLAVTLLPGKQAGARIQVFSLATGAEREWVWPGQGTVGEVTIDVDGGSNSWEADNRTLLFQVTTRIGNRMPGQLRLLDTAAPAGSLEAASTLIPVPSGDVGWQYTNAKHRIIGIPLITADGSKLIAPFFHLFPKPRAFGFTITEFSVRTGKPVQVLYQRRTGHEENSTGVSWVNASGTAAIVSRGLVFGVQTATSFTPLPPRVQRLIVQYPGLRRLPVW